VSNTIGGTLDLAALRTLHQPPNARQIADARHATRQALAALRAVEPAHISGESWQAVARCAAVLVDVQAELERVERRL
jgi:hypothetical protein